jgi:hypothetical protein
MEFAVDVQGQALVRILSGEHAGKMGLLEDFWLLEYHATIFGKPAPGPMGMEKKLLFIDPATEVAVIQAGRFHEQA